MTKDEMDRAYHDGFSHGMHVGLAMGRFYEKHGITDKVPPELADELNEVYTNALAECMAEINNLGNEGFGRPLW